MVLFELKKLDLMFDIFERIFIKAAYIDFKLDLLLDKCISFTTKI